MVRTMMTGRISRVSWGCCQHSDRDNLEQRLLDGEVTPKELDKELELREGTTDRHFRNHMGEYHMGANSECLICTSHLREKFEAGYFKGEITALQISEEIECPESTVYHHLKFHLKPLVRTSAAPLIAVEAGKEVETLRSNVERLNGELTLFLDEADRMDPQYVRNITTLHKEVRETVKDILKVQERAMGDGVGAGNINARTVNLIKVELAKESPEVWSRVRGKLLEMEDVIDDS